MKASQHRYLGWSIAGVIALAVIAFALWPRAVGVETVVAIQGRLETSIDADGVIRAHHRFTLAMPVTGILERIEIEPGASVAAGQIIGFMVPPDIDERQRKEASSHVRSIEAAGVEYEEQLASLRTLVEQTRRRADRLGRLDKAGAVAREQVENARDAYEQATRQYEALRARQRAHGYELQAARSVLSARPGQRIPLRAPSDGVVLRRYEQSERTVLAGTPILEIGDTSAMEVVIDVLSADAVKVTRGMSVRLEGWGGTTPLQAVVQRVEPAARTKVSSLGIEEQRVNVIADIRDCPSALGDGYRVEAAIITSRVDNALCIPLGALIRRGSDWFVLVNADGVANMRAVQLGARNAMLTVVTSGLTRGERVIVHPPESLADGDHVK